MTTVKLKTLGSTINVTALPAATDMAHLHRLFRWKEADANERFEAMWYTGDDFNIVYLPTKKQVKVDFGDIFKIDQPSTSVEVTEEDIRSADQSLTPKDEDLIRLNNGVIIGELPSWPARINPQLLDDFSYGSIVGTGERYIALTGGWMGRPGGMYIYDQATGRRLFMDFGAAEFSETEE